jgi:transcriptional regulator with XRE-family HTH domain
MASITARFSDLRDRTGLLHADVGDGHRAAQLATLELHAQDRARRNIQSLLNTLSMDHGLSWSDIARVAGVSVQAVRKWRKGDTSTGDHRLVIARLVAFIDLLEGYSVQDPAGWLEMPIVRSHALRYIDLYLAGRPELLFDVAALRISGEQALDELDPSWRETTHLDHEVFLASDGELAIRRKR